jgi:cell division septation protein DedD
METGAASNLQTQFTGLLQQMEATKNAPVALSAPAVPAVPAALTAPGSYSPALSSPGGDSVVSSASRASQHCGVAGFFKRHWGKIMALMVIVIIITVIAVRMALMKRAHKQNQDDSQDEQENMEWEEVLDEMEEGTAPGAGQFTSGLSASEGAPTPEQYDSIRGDAAANAAAASAMSAAAALQERLRVASVAVPVPAPVPALVPVTAPGSTALPPLAETSPGPSAGPSTSDGESKDGHEEGSYSYMLGKVRKAEESMARMKMKMDAAASMRPSDSKTVELPFPKSDIDANGKLIK